MVVESGGTCHNRIKNGLSDFLAPVPDVRERGKPLDVLLKHLLISREKAVIVINVGAHENDWPTYERIMSWLAKYLAQHKSLFGTHGRLRLLWRTNNSPHEDCLQRPFPETYRPSFKRNIQHHRSRHYFWKHVESYDDVAVDRLARTGLVSTIIDMTPTYLRPDAHDDCLHFCVNEQTGTPLTMFAYKVYDALRYPGKKVV